MRTSTELQLRAVAYREGDVFVIQGIEYDITAHARELSDLLSEFERAVVESCAITIHLGREPLAGIKPAPQRFADMFDQAELELNPVQGRVSTAGPRPDFSIRYFEEHEAA